MCGIVGYIGKSNNALKILIDGLKSLEYRGYDSSGIAYVFHDDIKIIKEKGKVSELEKDLDFSEKINSGIAHTRWATHGVPSKLNAHPHRCEKITLVHNGIIENYAELKNELEKKYKFKSETDTEVIAVLLNDIYKEKNDIFSSIVELKKRLKGSYALAIMCSDSLDKIYAIRKDSPLIIAENKEGTFLASDVPAIIKYTKKYYLLLEDEIAVLSCDNVKFYNDSKEEIKKELITFEGSSNDAEKEGYSHFMLKEINEEKSIIKKFAARYKTIEDLLKDYEDISSYDKIDIVACGSAYHVGVIAKYLIEEYVKTPVSVEIASEYRYKNNFLTNKSLAIFISQSGETADTLASLRKVKEEKVKTLSIVNVVGSSIARESDMVIYTKAGPEIAVATTKAFIAQLLVITYMTLVLGYRKELIDSCYINKILKEIHSLDISKIIDKDYTKVAEILKDKKSIFYLGRNIDYAIALEGSLKLKEISYIHSEAYASGELKHGTISLIEKNTPVISVLTKDAIVEKTISNIKEVKARGAFNIVVSPIECDFADLVINIPKVSDILMPIVAVIPLQLIAFETAKKKGCDIDKPRNLAKSVTVE
ncbi:MAG: glutamine--fructose-6-phosphate transaminase (isomerizing) [Bacilli bacterium]|nr:glutamine--fructose-6-phosphate transaminase (isomerizing) [Bacilli bacterium]